MVRRFLDVITAIMATEHDFSVRQIGVLLTCAETEGSFDRQVHRLADKMVLSRPVICRAADRLEDAGFIERQGLPGDKRACVLQVTKRGHQFIQQIYGEPEISRRTKRTRVAA